MAGEEVDTGTEAKCFADYMRIHTLEGTGGKTYAQMPRFATEDGAGTNEADQAQRNPDGSPMSNPARQIWVTETALSTALYTCYFAEGVSLFAIIVGVAMLLIGNRRSANPRVRRAACSARALLAARTGRRVAPDYSGMSGRRETLIVHVALVVIALAVLDDAFVHPEPGTGIGNHLVTVWCRRRWRSRCSTRGFVRDSGRPSC